jgi:hypothetical protein
MTQEEQCAKFEVRRAAVVDLLVYMFSIAVVFLSAWLSQEF